MHTPDNSLTTTTIHTLSSRWKAQNNDNVLAWNVFVYIFFIFFSTTCWPVSFPRSWAVAADAIHRKNLGYILLSYLRGYTSSPGNVSLIQNLAVLVSPTMLKKKKNKKIKLKYLRIWNKIKPWDFRQHWPTINSLYKNLGNRWYGPFTLEWATRIPCAPIMGVAASRSRDARPCLLPC